MHVSVLVNIESDICLFPAQPMATNAAFLQQLQRVNALAAIPGGVTQTGMVVNQPPTNSVLLVGNLNTEVNNGLHVYSCYNSLLDQISS